MYFGVVNVSRIMFTPLTIYHYCVGHSGYVEPANLGSWTDTKHSVLNIFVHSVFTV